MLCCVVVVTALGPVSFKHCDIWRCGRELRLPRLALVSLGNKAPREIKQCAQGHRAAGTKGMAHATQLLETCRELRGEGEKESETERD